MTPTERTVTAAVKGETEPVACNALSVSTPGLSLRCYSHLHFLRLTQIEKEDVPTILTPVSEGHRAAKFTSRAGQVLTLLPCFLSLIAMTILSVVSHPHWETIIQQQRPQHWEPQFNYPKVQWVIGVKTKLEDRLGLYQ